MGARAFLGSEPSGVGGDDPCSMGLVAPIRHGFQISGKGVEFARAGLDIAIRGYALSEMPGQSRNPEIAISRLVNLYRR